MPAGYNGRPLSLLSTLLANLSGERLRRFTTERSFPGPTTAASPLPMECCYKGPFVAEGGLNPTDAGPSDW